MALSKERKLYVAVLSLAAGGFALDRMFFGFTDAPSSARAEASSTGGAAAPNKTAAPAPAAVIALTSQQKASADLATRLRGLGVESDALATLADPFQVHVVASNNEQQAPAVVAMAPPPPLPTVTAVLLGSTPSIVADGRTVQIGGSIGLWRVIAITEDVVTFDCGGVIAESRSPVSRLQNAR